MLLTFFIVRHADIGEDIVIQTINLDKFPSQIGDYRAVKDIILQDSVIYELNTDAFVFRDYVDDEGHNMTLYIGYYGTRKGGRTGHNPYGCYPGGGWSILEDSTVLLPVRFNHEEKKVQINALLARKRDYTERVFFWYQSSANHVLSSGIEMNMHRFKSRLVYRRNDGAFVRVSSPIGYNPQETEQKIRNFSRLVVQVLEQYWPVEIEL